jgi:hypothetical protein
VSDTPRNRVRPAAVAGTFYPRDPHTLAATVDGLLADAAVRHSRGARGSLRAVIVPHAGYVYSGPIAAAAYSELRSCVARFRRVVVIGPAHRVPVRGLAVSSADVFATPLGAVTVDIAARHKALQVSGVVVDDAAHALEHSVEVQLPFLQRVAPGLPVLPLVVGTAPSNVVRALLDALWDDGTLLVVSTDLSHYLEYDQARAVDANTADHVVAERSEAIGDRDACGAYALRPLLEAGRARNLRVDQLDLRSSGDTAGGHDQVVGYGAFAVEAAA